MRTPITLLAATTLVAAAAAQQTVVIPVGATQTVSGPNDTSNPFDTAGDMRITYLYDATNFTTQGINFPIIISRVRFRPQESSSTAFLTGSSITTFRAGISTSQLGFDDPAITGVSSTNPVPFANLLGADNVEIFTTGTLTIGGFDGTLTPAGTPEPWHIDLDTNTTGTGATLLYDPTSGSDLAIDLESSGVLSTASVDECDAFFDGATARRVQNTGTPPFTDATTDANFALVAEITYNPAAGLFPSFSADVTSGNSPLLVTFTDTSFTSDPAGIQLVRFDFDNDGTFDANTTAGGTATNTYGCGLFSVTVEATDTLNGVASTTVTNAIEVDALSAAIGQDNTVVGTGQTVNFTTTADPAATLAWDLDGDGIIDDASATPSFTYNTAGLFNVTLTATLACNTATATTTVEVLQDAIFAPVGTTGNITGFTTPPDASYFDVNVTNPAGYVVREIIHRTVDENQPHDLEVWIQSTPGQTVVGNEDPSNFTLIATGNAVAPATEHEPFLVDVNDFLLPPGITGMAIVTRNSESGHSWWDASQGLSASNADITITAHSSTSNFDTETNGGATSTDSWAGGFIGSGVNDLLPDFTADVTEGPSPLLVQFTDTSITNDPVGVLSWSWDFQNDGIIDETMQNPTFTYANCGDFTVQLTVVDSLNGQRTATKPNLISTDNFTASFDQSGTLVGATNAVTFTYTGELNPAVTWDFDSDGVVDGAGNSVSHVYGTPGTYTITMSATVNCRTTTVTSTVDVINGSLITAPAGPAGTLTGFSSAPDASYFDLEVTNPAGVTIETLLFRSQQVGELHDMDIYIQYFNSVVDRYAASSFTLISSGSATPTVDGNLFAVDVADFGLPQGVHGIAVVSRDNAAAASDAGHLWYEDNAGLTSSTGDLILTPRASDTNFDTQSSNTAIQNTDDSFSGGFTYSVGGGFAPGTVVRFADGCPGSLGLSDVQQGTNPPAIGTTYSVRVTNVQAGVQLHGGISRTFNATFGVPLPLDLGPILGTQPACQWHVSSEAILLAFPNAFGEAVVSFPIPNNPVFQGLTVYYQGLIFDAAIQGSIVTSNAYLAVVQ